jgi:hypothetical protein
MMVIAAAKTSGDELPDDVSVEQSQDGEVSAP